MKLFISWSGPVSQQIAEALREWFPLLLPALEPFITTTDIDKGAKWQAEISHELEASSYGVVCLTAENLNSPWLAFEAGALSKHLDGRVATVLLGVSHGDVKPPLSMFQGTLFEEADIRKLIGSINAALPESNRRQTSQLETLFPKVWPDLRDQVELIVQNAPNVAAAPMAAPDQGQLLVEALALLRQQNALLSDPAKLFEPLMRSKLLDLQEELWAAGAIGLGYRSPAHRTLAAEAAERMKRRHAELTDPAGQHPEAQPKDDK